MAAVTRLSKLTGTPTAITIDDLLLDTYSSDDIAGCDVDGEAFLDGPETS